MALIGDLIIGLREAATDLPSGKIPAPGAEVLMAQSAVAGTLVAGNYFCQFTYWNEWGETSPKSAQTVTVDGPHPSMQLTGPSGITGFPPGITKVRAYFGRTSGQLNQYVDFTPAQIIAGTAIISAPGSAGYVPERNSAYLPDTDGKALSVSSVYRWFNDGVKDAATICGGGIPDFGGVQATVGQPVYVLPGVWKKIHNAWVDGYEINLGGRGEVFRRNRTSGQSAQITQFTASNRTVMELYPQPGRAGATTTLGADLSSTSDTATLATSNFLLPFGLALIGTEIVSFASNQSGSMTGLIRGMCGTTQTAWPSGTAVTELNFMWAGLRVPPAFAVGDASKTLPLPAGWETAMQKYLLSRFREADHNGNDAGRLKNEFVQTISQFNQAGRPIAGPVQIQPGGYGIQTAAGMGSRFGGVIIP